MEFFPGAFETEWEQRKAVLLHERALLQRKPLDEEERRRRGGAVPTASPFSRVGSGRLGFGIGSGRFAHTGDGKRASEPSMRSRFASLASGSQPAVVKMASFGGGGRLGAMISYVSRSGEIAVENERGEELRGRDELSAVRGEWDHLMKNRAESRDIGTFSLEVKEAPDPAVDMHEQAQRLLKRPFGDRGFAFAIAPQADGKGCRIEGVVVLRDGEGERLTADKKATEVVQKRLDGDTEQGATNFRFTGYGNGTDYGASRLRDLVARHEGAVQDNKGTVIADEKQAGDLVQLEWRDKLHSRKPRDVMHVIMSARAGTDAQAFHAAARDFLAQEFAGHRYVFSLHDPALDPKAEEAGGKRPHVHVHAIVAMRSDAGDRVETTIASFRHWRVTMAEKAREHGIRMEMTDRRERASSPAYTRNQVRPMSRAGRTGHQGTSPAAQRRYDAKRSDRPSAASTMDSKNYALSARQEWMSVAKESGQADIIAFASTQAERLASVVSRVSTHEVGSSVSENSRSQYRTNLVNLVKVVSEGETMRHMTRLEFETYEKRVETALFQAERVTPQDERKSFEEIASAARDHVNVRRELMELQEQNGRPDRREDRDAQDRDGDSRARWDDAVSRHGLGVVEAANRVMLEVERYRDEIEKADAGEIRTDKASLEASLQREIGKAAELGVAGNTLIREIAEADEELRVVIERAEQSRGDRSKSKAGATDGLEVRIDGGQEVGRDEGASARSTNVDHDHSQPSSEHVGKDGPRARAGDTTRTYPAQQHLPRLEQLEREADERREQDRDDRER